MNITRAISHKGWQLATILAVGLTGCSGGGGGGDSAPVVANSAISAAALVAANDSASNSSSAFAILQNAGVPVVTVASPPKINFTVFSDGAVKTGLLVSNLSVSIAKLVPGSNGDPDQWVNYIYRTESTSTATNNAGNNAGAPALASALQATSDPKPSSLANQLVYNNDGYYTYTFSTDIRDPAFSANSVKTNGVVFEPNLTHRVAIQLSYVNSAGATVRVNPYYDFKFVADGAGYKAVALTNPATETRKMADVTSCNTCHNQLALHGGGRVDVQYCVMCHNPGTTDANSGNALTMSTMVHKIHAGRRLGADALQIWGYGGTKHDYAEVGFPQDLRNCSKCHSGANAATPQGDNWKIKPTREACLSCHTSGTGSNWLATHDILATSIRLPNAAAMTNGNCAGCHGANTNLSAEQAHWNQGEENAAKYKVNIDSATLIEGSPRKVRVVYSVTDPTNANAAYNLTADCGGVACTTSKRFGNLRFYLAYKNLVGANGSETEWTSYNNGGSGANVFAYTGNSVGANQYSVDISVPADTATAIAQGTARVMSIGQIKEDELDVILRTPKAGPVLMNVSMQHTYKDVALTGALTPRRDVVSDAYCNNCHGTLGTTSGSNTLSTAFHSGARNSVIACALCHDANRSSTTVMADGSGYQESYQFKRMIHGIHGGAKRNFPFTHGNKNPGPWNKDGTLVADGVTPFATADAVENYSHEVAYPGILSDCTTCHLTDSVTGLGTYENDRSPFGAVISKKDPDPLTGTATTDPLLWKVISPKAATCTACHDSAAARNHVSDMTAGVVPGTAGGKFGNATQGQMISGAVLEKCNECHGSSGFASIKSKHSGLANPTNQP
jgi:OmcA/MtrC family decaheme c-type cytochrome